jgi:16S rRNA processing protein RimM
MAERRRILMGVVLGAHGTRGEVKVKSFAARASDIAAYGPLEDETGERRFEIEVVSPKATSAAQPGDGVVIARVRGIGDRDLAQSLKGARLYMARDRLPAIEAADTFYAADLVGLRALDRAGALLGSVVNVADYGAGPLLRSRVGPRAFAVPFSGRFVPGS